MTRKEAIIVIKSLKSEFPTKSDWLKLKEALDVIVQEELPLSSDVKEAAVEAFKRIVDLGNVSFLEIFKAGAEYMTKQGVSIRGKCSDGEFIDTEHGILSFDNRPFKDGDEVIITIRKK